eukprot:scaffold41044_cov68-Phaeocystis_antarctica.AAC.8
MSPRSALSGTCAEAAPARRWATMIGVVGKSSMVILVGAADDGDAASLAAPVATAASSAADTALRPSEATTATLRPCQSERRPNAGPPMMWASRRTVARSPSKVCATRRTVFWSLQRVDPLHALLLLLLTHGRLVWLLLSNPLVWFVPGQATAALKKGPCRLLVTVLTIVLRQTSARIAAMSRMRCVLSSKCSSNNNYTTTSAGLWEQGITGEPMHTFFLIPYIDVHTHTCGVRVIPSTVTCVAPLVQALAWSGVRGCRVRSVRRVTADRVARASIAPQHTCSAAMLSDPCAYRGDPSLLTSPLEVTDIDQESRGHAHIVAGHGLASTSLALAAACRRRGSHSAHTRHHGARSQQG